MPVSALTFDPLDPLTDADCDRMAEATQPYAAFTPTVTGVTTSARSGRWLRHGDNVTLDFSITLSAAPTSTIEVVLPANASAAFGSFASQIYPRGVCGVVAGAVLTPGFIVVSSATTLRFLTAGGAYFDAAAPAGLGSTHIISGHLEYEAA